MNWDLEFYYNNLDNLNEKEKTYLFYAINQIINKKGRLNEMEAKLLIKYAIMQKCKKNGYPLVKVEFLDEREVPEKNKNAGGYYLNKNNTIYICPNTIKDQITKEGYPFFSKVTNHVERLLIVAFHECEHYFQHYECKNNSFNLKSYYYMMHDIALSLDSEEYKRNYLFKQIENEANISAWQDTLSFLAEHKYSRNIKELLASSIRSWERKSFSYQKKDDKEYLIEDYNVIVLIYACLKYPSLVEQYPILKNFFYSEGGNKGRLKDINILIRDYNQMKRHHIISEDKQIVYREFFYYLFRDVNNITKDSGLIVLDLIVDDFISLQSIFDHNLLKSDSNKKKQWVVYQKVNRIIKFYDAIKRLNLINTVYDGYASVEEVVFDHLRETLKVYETAKRMGRTVDNEIEKYVQLLRKKFNFNDIEFRQPEGRISAINI